MTWENKLICGDNLEKLATIEKESIDLIYIDPPFFSNRNYEIIWGDESEIRSFEDRWEGGIEVYIDWMKQRVIELYRVLKKTGTFYLHCDWHASHYLKVMCDTVFDYRNFRNEIAWCYSGGGVPKKDFARKHDIILRYSKSNDYIFNIDAIRQSYSEEILSRPKSSYAEHSYRKTPNRKTVGWDLNPLGKHPDDWFYMAIINPDANERIGYPTQKPEKLLERFILSSSNKGDIVLDAFCGCGTAMAVAQKHSRHWIGIDISPSAITLVKNRLAKIGVNENNADIIGLPTSVDELRKFKHFDFQYWVVNEMHGTPSPKKVGDMGIDGLSFLNHYPIQVKQSDAVGRNVVDNFETALRRFFGKNVKEFFGYIIAFSFTRGAYEEVARVKKEGFKIELIEVQDILNRKFVITQEIKKDEGLF